jgi:hypothetical protein
MSAANRSSQNLDSSLPVNTTPNTTINFGPAQTSSVDAEFDYEESVFGQPAPRKVYEVHQFSTDASAPEPTFVNPSKPAPHPAAVAKAAALNTHAAPPATG